MVEKADINLEYDLAYLHLLNSNHISNEKEITEKFLTKQANENFGSFLKECLKIREICESRRNNLDEDLQTHDFTRSTFEINMPDPKTIFPRHKKIPLVKTETKWEKFAKDKGINKIKRSRMVWDDTKKDWVPRWGFKSIKQNLEENTPILEEKFGDNGDPFLKRRLEKKLKAKKQSMREMKNKISSMSLFIFFKMFYFLNNEFIYILR